MAQRHSGWSQTAQGTRANSQGRPRASRREAGSLVDIDGVPLTHTRKSDTALPAEFYEDFKKDPVAAYAKWTAEEA